MTKNAGHGVEQRRDTIKSHLVSEHRHDPYKTSGKLSEPTLCPQCGAVYAKGRWQWMDDKPQQAESRLCPACHRTNDNYPAGEVTLSGSFLDGHRGEILALARNTEAAEKRSHPLQRIMAIDEADDRLVITTTDIHLPRRIGHALEHAYKGKLETHYDKSGYFVRIAWSRSD